MNDSSYLTHETSSHMGSSYSPVGRKYCRDEVFDKQLQTVVNGVSVNMFRVQGCLYASCDHIFKAMGMTKHLKYRGYKFVDMRLKKLKLQISK